MPALYIECPVTKQLLNTGKIVPRTMPADHLIGNMVKCEYCNAIHKWLGREAFFIENGNRKYLH